MVLLRVTDYDDAGMVAEKIRIAVEEAAFTMARIRITLSAGVAPLSMTLGFDEAFKLADKALYRSKNNGRNRCHGYLAFDATEKLLNVKLGEKNTKSFNHYNLPFRYNILRSVNTA